jgi:prepilin peptidase CpaA
VTIWDSSLFAGLPLGPWWGALFSGLLVAACVTDVRERRIPNLLVLVILATGIGFSLSVHPTLLALRSSAAGVGLGFAIWIGFWLLGLLGAGDVKFFAATGAWLGPGAVWRAALMAAVLGGVLALYALWRKRQLREGMERTALALSSRSLGVLASTTDDSVASRRQHLPYGVALAGGALAAAWFPRLLS